MKVLTANKLAPGEVVYWNGSSGWMPDLQQAQLLEDAEAASTLKTAAEWVARNEVVAPYLFPVRLENGRIVPATARELIRARGPSVRLDLGKQAA
jgi:Protein of unknown function (DUF2849)